MTISSTFSRSSLPIKKGKVLLSRDDEGHSRGYYVIARTLRDAGIEVILGGVQTPKEIVTSALQEDVSLIGYHIMTGAPDILISMLFEKLQESKLDIPVIVGGIILPQQVPKLKEMGVKGVLTPGSRLDLVVDLINRELPPAF